MTPAERISSDTWRRLSWADHFGARLGEETMTDLLILDMMQFPRNYGVCVFHPTRLEESRCGADLMVWIRRRKGRSRFLAIQAKKLYNGKRYNTLNHYTNRGIRQIDLLEAFARQYHAIPLYLLYNHFDLENWRSFWHCCKSPDIEQLGCTLVPSWKINRAINERGKRTFTAVHANATSLPWRCVFDCGQAEQQLKVLVTSHKQRLSSQDPDPDATRTATMSWYPQLLDINFREFLRQMDGPSFRVDFDNLRMEINEKLQNTREGRPNVEQEQLYPRKLLVVDEYVNTIEESEAWL